MLSQYATIYLPTKRADGQPLPKLEQEAKLRWLLTEMVRFFGGATATPAIGAWSSRNGILVMEPITRVTSYLDSVDRHVPRLYALAQIIKEQAGQESVAIETPDGMEFV